MAEPSYLKTPQGRRIAYHLSAGQGPAVVFLGGFRSDMEGTKALHLETWARARGQSFLRLDYSGHGQSSGDFLEGCISEWTNDAFAAISTLVDGPVVLVGSSMGGWISLSLARKLPGKICGIVGIASAPDFTEDSMWAMFSVAQREELAQNGQIALPSDYSDEPYIITRKLIEDGRQNLVLRDPLPLLYPVRFLQGTADEDVSVNTALRLLSHVTGGDIRLTLVKDADHRFSTPECLALIEAAVSEALALQED